MSSDVSSFIDPSQFKCIITFYFSVPHQKSTITMYTESSRPVGKYIHYNISGMIALDLTYAKTPDMTKSGKAIVGAICINTLI